MKRKQLNLIILLMLYSFFIAGAVFHMFEATRQMVLLMTPFTLLICGAAVVITSFRGQRKFIAYLVITWVITFIIEVLGVKTGSVFGNYWYGGTLGLKVFEVPVIIGLNWVILVMGGTIFVRDVLKIGNPIMGACFAGLVTTYVDLFIEPVAIRFDYWTWQSIMPGFKNYFAWWLITAVFAIIFYALKIKPKSSIIVHYVLIQLIFFIMIYMNIAL